MNKKDSWTSQFRKNRFYENQRRKYEKQFLDEFINEIEIPKTINILLDLDGTCDFINDEKATIFIKQLEILRKKFSAKTAKITISTHYKDPNKMIEVLDILSRNLLDNIKIGNCYYYGGIYNYSEKEATYLGDRFNANKVNTFHEYCFSFLSNNQWIGIIDDNISEDVYKNYKNTHPMLLGRPSQTNDNYKNNFMSISTTTKGFDGVIEILNNYIESINKLTPHQILVKQKNMITPLSNRELIDKIYDKEYEFIKFYFEEGLASENDYLFILDCIIFMSYSAQQDDLIYIQKVIQLLLDNAIVPFDEYHMEKIKKIQKNFPTV